MRRWLAIFVVIFAGFQGFGQLKIHPGNPRYFTDGSARPIYLTGSHTWANLIDRGPADPPPKFDFEKYLDLLQTNNHNFIRLWTRHVSHYHGYGTEPLHASPLPWARTGPGNALDKKPKFDLTKLSEEYFKRLRDRVKAAGSRGIYVGVMLFGGNYECEGGWRGNPFHPQNNINNINGDPGDKGNGQATHTLQFTNIVRLQEIYVRKVLVTLGDLDNVLFEISNEGAGSSLEWQKYWVDFIRKEEGGRDRLIGITALYLEDGEQNNRLLAGTSADWIAPFASAKMVRNLPPNNGLKPLFMDSDHWFVKELYNDSVFGAEWVWKAFCRGYHVLLMEHLPPLSFVDPDYPISLEDRGYTASRRAMGHTRKFADRMNLAAMKPSTTVSTTGYCLVQAGKEYLVYQPGKKEFEVSIEPGSYKVEWFNPVSGVSTNSKSIEGGNRPVKFNPPFDGTAVLYLKRI